MTTDKRITVVIVEDHEPTRKGYAASINEDNSLQLVAEAINGTDGLEKIVRLQPDVAAIDIVMPPGMNGLELSRLIKKQCPNTEIVIMTIFADDEAYFLEAMSIGISGYVTKFYIEELITAIKQVYNGETYLSPKVHKFLTLRKKKGQELENETPGLKDLTPREREVLILVAENKSNKYIAKELSPIIDERTVETHRNNICNKLKLKGKHALLVFALQNRHLL